MAHTADSSPSCSRVRSQQLASVAQGGSGCPVAVLTVEPELGEDTAAAMLRLAGRVVEGGWHAVALMAWGDVAARIAGSDALARGIGHGDFPVTWVEGASCRGRGLAGAQLFVIPAACASSARFRTVSRGGRVMAVVFDDGNASHCLLGGIGPSRPGAEWAEQTEDAFETLVSVLDEAGFSVADIARTWFFNRDLLGWYSVFNRVRTSFYAPVAWRSGSLPASTGVAGTNVSGAALEMAAWAVKPLAGCEPGVVVREVVSPLQCPAASYGSSFSRAMEIRSAGGRRVLVSGTASIAPDGRSVWLGDAARQIDLTMEVVEAMLQPQGLGLTDVTRAVAYFKSADDKPLFDKWLRVRGLEDLPRVSVHCDICRDDLLFEIELDAAPPE